MDIDVQIENVKLALTAMTNYKTTEAQKTAVTGETTGTLKVNGEDIIVTGTEFDDLLTAKVSDLTTILSTIKTSIQRYIDIIDADLKA